MLFSLGEITRDLDSLTASMYAKLFQNCDRVLFKVYNENL